MKKNELEKKRPALFFLGIIAACATTLTAFEWKTIDHLATLDGGNMTEVFNIEPDLPEIVITLDKPLLDASPVTSSPTTVTRKIEVVKEIFSVKKKIAPIPSNMIPESRAELLKGSVMDPDKSLDIRSMRVNDMPYTMKCGEIEDPAERFQCTRLGLSNMVRERFRFPPSELLPDFPERVKVSFSIDVYGNISDISMAKDTPEVLRQEIIRTFRTLPAMHPGRHDGRPVKVTFELPMTLIRE